MNPDPPPRVTAAPHRKRIPTPGRHQITASTTPARNSARLHIRRTTSQPGAHPGNFSNQWCLQTDRGESSGLPGEPPRGQQSAVRRGPRVAVEDHRLDQGSHGLEISTVARRVETPACATAVGGLRVLGSPSLTQNSTAKSLDAGEPCPEQALRRGLAQCVPQAEGRAERRECALRSGRGPITLCERTWQVAGFPTLDAIRCPDLRSTSSADQPDLRGVEMVSQRDPLARRALTYSVAAVARGRRRLIGSRR